MAAPSTRNIVPLLQFTVTPAVYVPRSPGVDSGFGHFYWDDRQQTVQGRWPENVKEEQRDRNEENVA